MSFDDKVKELKYLLINTYEIARLYTKDLDDELQSRLGHDMSPLDDVKEPDGEHPMRILQFALMVDVKGAGMIPTLVRFQSRTCVLLLIREHFREKPSLLGSPKI
jgi:hypothetical protein